MSSSGLDGVVLIDDSEADRFLHRMVAERLQSPLRVLEFDDPEAALDGFEH